MARGTKNIVETIDVKIVDPESLYVGMKNEGWELIKQYDRFNLWQRKTLLGDIRRECFKKYELPKKLKVVFG